MVVRPISAKYWPLIMVAACCLPGAMVAVMEQVDLTRMVVVAVVVCDRGVAKVCGAVNARPERTVVPNSPPKIK